MTGTSAIATCRHDDSVNGLRGLMLMIIVMTHYVPTTFFSGNLGRPAAAVMLAVTGYFFMGVFQRQVSIRDQPIGPRIYAGFELFGRRHLRIWPVLAGVVAMYAVLGFLSPDPLTTQIHDTWPFYLLYMGNLVKMLFEGQAFPAHFWLISAQEQFIAFALIVASCTNPRSHKKLLLSAIVLGVTARLIGCVIWMPAHPALATESPLAIADALALGMLCRVAIVEGQSKTRMRRQIWVAIVVTALVWSSLPNSYSTYFGILPFITALIGCLFILHLADDVRSRRLQTGFFAQPLLVATGQMSLSLFLIHPLVSTVLRLSFTQETGELMPWWLLAAIGLPLSVLVSYAYFRAIEIPVQQLGNLRSSKNPPKSQGEFRPPLATSEG